MGEWGLSGGCEVFVLGLGTLIVGHMVERLAGSFNVPNELDITRRYYSIPQPCGTGGLRRPQREAAPTERKPGPARTGAGRPARGERPLFVIDRTYPGILDSPCTKMGRRGPDTRGNRNTTRGGADDELAIMEGGF